MRPPLPRRAFACALAAVALVALAASVVAVGQSSEQGSRPIREDSSTPAALDAGGAGSALRLIIGLAVVVGLIVVVWWVLKRVQRKNFPQGEARGGAVEVIATTSLGPNRSLHLIEVAGELVLIGATDHGIAPIARISGDPTGDVLDLGAPDPGVGTGGYSSANARPSEGFGAGGSLVDRLRAMTTRP